MSELSEFERHIELKINEYWANSNTDRANLHKDGIRIGARWARDWFLNKANKLEKHYIDDNDFPLIFLDDLKEALK